MRLPEFQQLEFLAERHPEFFRIRKACEIPLAKGGSLPQYSFELCHESVTDKALPTLGLFAGVHGIEAIGVKILMSFIDHLLAQASWNRAVQQLLTRVRIVGIPIVNPAGFVASTRSNGNGVDLMRNAPVECAKPVPLIGGQKLSPRLPYFQGWGYFERENQELVRIVEDVLWNSPFSLSLDIHSGFGTSDYLWTPYAKQYGVPPTWDDYLQVKSVLDSTLRNHVYTFEPQSVQYCTSGDVWDHLYDKHLALFSEKSHRFLPLTLEVGSWVWIKKSPQSAFSWRNFFNPVHPHRERRVLRRHLALLTLLMHLAESYESVFNEGKDASPVRDQGAAEERISGLARLDDIA